MKVRDRSLLAGLGAAIVAVFAGVARIEGLEHRLPLFLSLYGAGFVLYAAAVVIALRSRDRSVAMRALVVAVALAARLVLVPATPVLSSDIHRYLWEGRVIAHGFNPFAHAPDAPELAGLRDENYEGVSHKEMVTIYPPVSQAVFALGALVRPNLSTQKLVFVLFDVGTVLLLMSLLGLRGANETRSLIYAWSPLVVFETGHSGHLDAIGVFLTVLGLWFLARRHRARAFVALAAGFLSKFFTGILAPYFLVRRRYAPWLLLSAAVVVAGYLPFAGAGAGLFSSLGVYSSKWQFNGVPYLVIVGALGHPLVARWILSAALVAFALVQAIRREEVERYAFLTIGCALLLTPTLYPWYLLWVVPFLCLFPNRAWILFTGLVFASYWVWVVLERTGQWRLPAVVYAVEYAPFYALLSFDAWRARRKAVTS
jgi:alpha-1,6-mannosyltransferase